MEHINHKHTKEKKHFESGQQYDLFFRNFCLEYILHKNYLFWHHVHFDTYFKNQSYQKNDVYK